MPIDYSPRGMEITTVSNTDPWVIRTSFENEASWKAVCDKIGEPQSKDHFLASVQYVNDQRFNQKSVADVVHLLPDDYPCSFCFIVDHVTLESDEQLVLVVRFDPPWNDEIEEFDWKPPRQISTNFIKYFYALPSAIQSIENNLSLANMDFADFADSVDEDGVFRSF